MLVISCGDSVVGPSRITAMNGWAVGCRYEGYSMIILDHAGSEILSFELYEVRIN
jgi:hypothetical protein